MKLKSQKHPHSKFAKMNKKPQLTRYVTPARKTNKKTQKKIFLNITQSLQDKYTLSDNYICNLSHNHKNYPPISET